jgi:hypothetical protein
MTPDGLKALGMQLNRSPQELIFLPDFDVRNRMKELAERNSTTREALNHSQTPSQRPGTA